MIVSCGIIPFIIKDGKPQYLMLKSYNYWDFPKGKQEEGERDIDTALRETEEEAGLTEFKFIVSKYVETKPYRGSGGKKVGRYFIGEVLDPDAVEIKPNPESGKIEHEEYRWFDYMEGMKIAVPRIQEVLSWGHKNVLEYMQESE